MGFFKNLVSKQGCTFCGNEVGAMHRTKIKGDEYVCNECARKCSEWVRLSEMDRTTVDEHMKFMEKRNRIYEKQFDGVKKSIYPGSGREYRVVFADDLGMLAIQNIRNNKRKENVEVIRYDEIERYEPYLETTTEDGKQKFKEAGIKRKLMENVTYADRDIAKKGVRNHPYIKHEIKLAFRTSERDTNYEDNAIQHLDYIFGVHDNEHALFGGMSKAEKRNLQAGVEMTKLMGGMLKGAIKGDAKNDEALKEQFSKAQETADAAGTGGMSVYTRRADEAEEKAD